MKTDPPPSTTSGPASPDRPARRLLGRMRGSVDGPPPVWLMRQAGRYLPEYRETRARAGSFLDLCYNPPLAAEVTLQPIRRYGFDAAILFSDILVVPHALGQRLEFLEGEGPRLEPITEAGQLGRLDPGKAGARYAIIAETVQLLRQDLPAGVELIGFCGAPWTVATYMVEGGGSPDQAAARLWAYRDPEGFGRLIDLLVTTSVEYLRRQIEAGANIVQVFDTWAGSLPPAERQRWVIEPTRRIIAGIRASHPGFPVLAFPRGLDGPALARFADGVGLVQSDQPGGISVGTAVDLGDAAAELADRGLGKVATQGNLDPLAVVAGGAAMEQAVRAILEATRGRPHIFNLGHGIVPGTPPEHVARLVGLVRS